MSGRKPLWLAVIALAVALVTAAPAPAYAWFNDVTDTYYASQEVTVSGDPIYASDVPAGEYSIKASTSSSMCRLSNVTLTATGSELWVTFSTSGAYNVIYPGTAAEAAALTNEDGTDASNYYAGEPFEGYVPHQFSMPIDALNAPMNLATYTGGKDMATGMWWDRTVVFNSSKEVEDAINGASEPVEPEPSEDEPTEPEDSENPEDPEDPGDSGNPEDPEGPGDPGNPEDPEGPGDPGNSEQSETDFYIEVNEQGPYTVGQTGVVAALKPGSHVVTWESTDESVFSVNANGVLKFVGAGTAELWASVSGEDVGPVIIEVQEPEGGAGGAGSGDGSGGGNGDGSGDGDGSGKSNGSGKDGDSGDGGGGSKAKYGRSISLAKLDALPLEGLSKQIAEASMESGEEIDLTPFMAVGFGVIAANLALVGALLMGLRRTRPRFRIKV